jgi:hypothetical protein
VDQAGDDGRHYWVDVRPLTGQPTEDDAEAAPSAGAELRAAWSAGRSTKDRLTVLRNADVRAIAGDLWRKVSAPRPIMRFAEANGLDFAWQDHAPLPGMIFRLGERRSILTYRGVPEIEFGNFNSVGRELVQEFGYVAIRHGLGLPHLVLDARANDAAPPRGSRLYAKKGHHTSLTQNYRGSDSSTPMGSVGTEVRLLDLGAEVGQHFATYCEAGREAESRAFLTAELSVMTDLTRVFDVEVTADWIFLYAYGIEVVTDEPDRWLWIFSVTSQVLDRVQVWGRARDAPVIEEFPHFYTEARLERPATLAKLPTPSPGWNAFWSDSLWG